MEDASVSFRKKSLELLRAAMAARETEAVGAIRAIMSAVDNAGAIHGDQIAKMDPSVKEVPRKPLTNHMIAEIIQAEIIMRKHAQAEYEHLGNPTEAEKFRISQATLEDLLRLVD
jgi:uncharacterized protein YqeY